MTLVSTHNHLSKHHHVNLNGSRRVCTILETGSSVRRESEIVLRKSSACRRRQGWISIDTDRRVSQRHITIFQG
ncbi:hypothetical protein NY2A_b217R [Paramecium bursaria Chlorella virus NY2A]|uniref:Uncharacterized protein b217R n=1 Tax=Paramecium bursaria Chlorella virus NY2A TaxID=46021 RepID=A7IW92_PBCVN|nr:hypothetical protein NY2A_b217R [Paramecium bursaria Chlorella virus NY2A]ABT14616.1 hypothetical protein NY2A_b217R [Paramecium bursaria Chlorella virus NY2A]